MRSRVYKTVRCPSVRQSVCPISQTQQRRAAGLLLSAVRSKDIDRQRRAPGSSSAAARVRSTALSSKCGQRHVNASEQPEQPDRDETVQMSNTSGSGSEWITLAELGTELQRPLRDRTTWTYFEGSRTKLLLSIFRHFSRVTSKKNP